MINSLIFLLALLIIAYIVYLLLTYNVHIYMIKTSTKKYGYGSYKQFIQEFKKYKWNTDSIFKDSLFDYKTDSEYHADIIKFDGIGMIINNPIDWIRVKMFVEKLIKEYNKSNLHQW